MRIGIDLMGGDNSPTLLFEAVFLAAQQQVPSLTFILFATQPVIDDLQVRYALLMSSLVISRIEFCSVTEVIAMDDDPLPAVRSKKGASLIVGMRMLKKRLIDAFLSNGNTGALIAAAALLLPKLLGMNRPALLALLPTRKNNVAIIDIGGNLYCKAHHLVQFAQIGAIYLRCSEGIATPTVGLLNIGIESKKGTKELRQAYQTLQEMSSQAVLQGKEPSFHFAGNVEGREVFDGDIDLLVADGFTGNVLLKTAEGVAGFMLDSLKEIRDKSTSQSKLKSHIDGEHAIDELMTKFDTQEYPGAIICGVDGIVIKCHGNASPEAIYNSIIGTIALIEKDLIGQIKKISSEL